MVFGNLQPNMIVRVFHKTSYQNVFQDTEGALRRPMDTRWTGVTAQTLFHDGPGNERGTKSLAEQLPSVTKGRMGPALGHDCKERFSKVLCGFKRRGEHFSTGYSYPAST